jgi:hypothetical protein
MAFFSHEELLGALAAPALNFKLSGSALIKLLVR